MTTALVHNAPQSVHLVLRIILELLFVILAAQTEQQLQLVIAHQDILITQEHAQVCYHNKVLECNYKCLECDTSDTNCLTCSDATR